MNIYVDEDWLTGICIAVIMLANYSLAMLYRYAEEPTSPVNSCASYINLPGIHIPVRINQQVISSQCRVTN